VTPEVQAFATGFPLTLLHAGVTLCFLIVGVAVYVLLTPHKEIRLAREGNAAAALALGAVMVGLAIPLAVSMASSITLIEIGVWGVATTAVQLLVLRLTDFVLPGLPQRIAAGEVSAAVLLAAAKLSAALVLAAAVAG